MSHSDNLNHARLMAEIIRLQRWAGGDAVSAARIFGLMHGFESTISRLSESEGISKATQRKVEDILDEVEKGTQATDGMSIKDRLQDDEIDESVALRVMELCRLESRFVEAVKRIENDAQFPIHDRLPEQDWFGSLHFMELVDMTDGARTPMHAVYAAAIPRVGEIVTPQQGSTMVVVGVDHVVGTQGVREGVPQPFLIPHILLEIADDEVEVRKKVHA